jgi:hypothetical protein
MQVHSKENVLAFLPDKQKDPNIVTLTSKMQKPDLTCKVCGITSTSQKAMQDHLEGKAHKRKVSKLPQPMPALKVKTNMVLIFPILYLIFISPFIKSIQFTYSLRPIKLV